MENYIKTAIRYAEGKMSGGDFEIEQASEPELDRKSTRLNSSHTS